MVVCQLMSDPTYAFSKLTYGVTATTYSLIHILYNTFIGFISHTNLLYNILMIS